MHYAVNCASTSCPNLAATAFTGAKLEEMLDDGARAYVNHPRGVSAQDGKLTLSQHLQMVPPRLRQERSAMCSTHVAKYAKPALKKKLAEVGDIAGYDL